MSRIVVTPPAAAARVAVAKPSHSVRPGSLTCTWVSTRPGSSTSSSASSIISAASSAASYGSPRRSAAATATAHAVSVRRRPPAGPGRQVHRGAHVHGHGRRRRAHPRLLGRDPGADPFQQRSGCSKGSSGLLASSTRAYAARTRHRPAAGRAGSRPRHGDDGHAGRRAAAATPAGALPFRVWASSEPSPVTTRSTPARALLESRSAPGRTRHRDAAAPPSTAMAPKPIPPAAPAPGVSRRSGHRGCDDQSRPAGSRRVEGGDVAGSAPSAGRRPRAAPFGPSQRVVDVGKPR